MCGHGRGEAAAAAQAEPNSRWVLFARRGHGSHLFGLNGRLWSGAWGLAGPTCNAGSGVVVVEEEACGFRYGVASDGSLDGAMCLMPSCLTKNVFFGDAFFLARGGRKGKGQ